MIGPFNLCPIFDLFDLLSHLLARQEVVHTRPPIIFPCNATPIGPVRIDEHPQRVLASKRIIQGTLD